MPHGLTAVRLITMRTRSSVFAALVAAVILPLSGCGGPHVAPDAGQTRSPNTDTQRYAIDAPAAAIRLGMSLPEFERAIPIPPKAKPHLAPSMPAGYGLWGWTSDDGDAGVIGYFHAGRLIQADYAVGSLAREAANRQIEDYVRRYGEPVQAKSPERILRRFGNGNDACTMEIETFRSGSKFRLSVTLTDTAELGPMNRALQAITGDTTK
jgi:hypothetical protein